MEEIIERLFHARVIRWAEPDDDGLVWEVVTPKGVLLRADSLHLLIEALTEEEPGRDPPRFLLAA